MLDVQTLLSLGLPDHLISVWQVFIYLAFMVPLLLLQRVKLCLLITYLFAYYLAFVIYWADFIAASGSMAPFVLYALSGLAIGVLFAASSYADHRAQTNQSQGG